MIIYQVDAFTNQIFRGNPAGVCILYQDPGIDDVMLQNLAMEMNLSETAFLSKREEGYDLRWFTPETEVDFCGHATLSTAHILWETGAEKHDSKIIFNTRSGILTATRKGDRIELDFPSLAVKEIPPDNRINSALGIKPLFTGTDGRRYLLEIASYAELVNIRPDYMRLKDIGRTAFMITCRGNDDRYDFHSRFFAPAVGIDEDPVTGSAHSYLAPYWNTKLDKKILTAYQASARGGEIECELAGNDRVLLRGKAITVFEIKVNI